MPVGIFSIPTDLVYTRVLLSICQNRYFPSQQVNQCPRSLTAASAEADEVDFFTHRKQPCGHNFTALFQKRRLGLLRRQREFLHSSR